MHSTHLKQQVERCGFIACSIDQYLFINKTSKYFCLIYIDNVIWVAPNQKQINKVLEALKGELKLMVEGDVTAFL